MTVKNYSAFDGNLTASKEVLSDVLCDLYRLINKLDVDDRYRECVQKKADAIYNALDEAGYYNNIK